MQVVPERRLSVELRLVELPVWRANERIGKLLRSPVHDSRIMSWHRYREPPRSRDHTWPRVIFRHGSLQTCSSQHLRRGEMREKLRVLFRKSQHCVTIRLLPGSLSHPVDSLVSEPGQGVVERHQLVRAERVATSEVAFKNPGGRIRNVIRRSDVECRNSLNPLARGPEISTEESSRTWFHPQGSSPPSLWTAIRPVVPRNE